MEQNVTLSETSVNDYIAFIKPSAFRLMLGNVSRMTEHRLRRDDPDFPVPHPRFGYVLGEARGYIAKKAAERSLKR
jgi:hypothetical protein